MGNVSNTGPSHVQQFLFNLAAFVIIVAGMRASSEILIPFLLAIFISVIANPLVIKLRSQGIPITGASKVLGKSDPPNRCHHKDRLATIWSPMVGHALWR